MFPEESMQISAFITNKETISRFSQRKTAFIIVCQKAMWLGKNHSFSLFSQKFTVGYEEEKELKSWKSVFSTSNIPDKESIEVNHFIVINSNALDSTQKP
jgi:hypothetical protein